MLSRFAVAFALGVTPGIAVAQAPGLGLPFVTIDALVGETSIPGRAGSTFYESEHFPVARAAVAVRLGSRAGFRPVAVLDYSSAWGRGDDLVGCRLAPNGTCEKRFPSFQGVALGLGFRRAVGSRLTLGVTGGVGRYTRSYAIPNENTTGYHAEADLSLRFTKRAGVVLNIRHVEVEKFQHARMWYRPITVGLRFQ